MTIYWWYVIRLGQIGAIFRSVFGSRSNEIWVFANAGYTCNDMLNIAQANSHPNQRLGPGVLLLHARFIGREHELVPESDREPDR